MNRKEKSDAIIERLIKKRKQVGEVNGKATYETKDGKEVYGNNRPVSGGVSGALDPESDKDQEATQKHADMFYEAVRKRKKDYKMVAKSAGISEKEALEIKDYLFISGKRDDGEHLDASFEISQSWQRLTEGKYVRNSDRILIQHELEEMKLRKQGMTQTEAHEEADKKYGYKKALKAEREEARKGGK